MKTASAIAVFCCLALAGCSHSDTVHAKNEADKAGREIKQDLHKAGQEIKKDLHEAGREIDKAANNVKKDVHEKTK